MLLTLALLYEDPAGRAEEKRDGGVLHIQPALLLRSPGPVRALLQRTELQQLPAGLVNCSTPLLLRRHLHGQLSGVSGSLVPALRLRK